MNESSNLDDSSASGADNELQHPSEFVAFKVQQEKVQTIINECSTKIVNQTLCANDLAKMESEIKIMTGLENEVPARKMKSSYVSYRTKSLKLIQESYRICNWLMEKQSKEMDNVFDINSYIDLILSACADTENPLYHINTLFDNVMKNTNRFGLNFFGNIKVDDISEPEESTQLKKQIRRSQKRPLEEQIVPVEVTNQEEENEMKKNLLKLKSCLKQAIKKNHGKPISFYKFVIDPFSFTYTVENIFNLASLAKDYNIKFERVSDNGNNEFTTVTYSRKPIETSSNKNNISSLFTINYDLWKYYINKYNITEQMIQQD